MIPELLARWHAKQPLPRSFGRYVIGDYEFGVNSNDGIYAVCGVCVVIGQPALDWLRGAVEREIDKAGLDVRTEIDNRRNQDSKYIACIYNNTAVPLTRYSAVGIVEALLTAWVSYLEAKK